MNNDMDQVFKRRDDFEYQCGKDAIAVFDNVYPDGFCKRIIDNFHFLQERGFTHNRQNSENAPKTRKNDNATDFNNMLYRDMNSHACIDMKNSTMFRFNDHLITDIFHTGLSDCFDVYAETWFGLKNMAHHSFFMKVQETPPGGGYHVWHYEHGPGEFATRSAVFILYLNTLAPEQNGDTEFIHQEKRVSPVENRMVIWPAGYTHLHRGNPVYGEQSKYIVTGWFQVDQHS